MSGCQSCPAYRKKCCYRTSNTKFNEWNRYCVTDSLIGHYAKIGYGPTRTEDQGEFPRVDYGRVLCDVGGPLRCSTQYNFCFVNKYPVSGASTPYLPSRTAIV